MHLSPQQAAVAELPDGRTAFLEGPAGTGKTAAGVARLQHLIATGVPGSSILVIVPQRTLGAPYTAALRRADLPPGGEVTLLTLGGLAQRMVELFWPLVSAAAGFAQPDRPPAFLTLETAQYYMARLAGPLLDQGYFDSVIISRNRLYSQILDNLNKAAVVGFPHEEIGARLKAAWVGESSQARVYDEAQECANRFREYCLAHNLLDFSLQYDTFTRHVWTLPACRDLLLEGYRHLIADNVEEDTPAAHDILLEWLPHCRSALVIYDRGGGNRRFLGADPESAGRLKAACGEHLELTESYVTSADTGALLHALDRAFGRKTLSSALAGPPGTASSPSRGGGNGRLRAQAGSREADETPAAQGSARAALDFSAHRFYPEMLEWVADRIAGLVGEEGVPADEIVVLAPFLTGALRFTLAHALERRGVAARSHRPSRALREEPAVVCLLTLAALCHPGWGIRPARSDVAHALMLAIDGMDLVRAHLLAAIAYREVDGLPSLGSFAQIEPAMQERITFLLGGRYEGLRAWLKAHTAGGEWQMANGKWQMAGKANGSDDQPSSIGYQPSAISHQPSAIGHKPYAREGRPEELDHFLGRLFGELLSQPGYGFHKSYDAGEITAVLIESARKFRQVMVQDFTSDAPRSLAWREYVEMVHEGVVAAQYVRSWQRQPRDAVLLAPAYTFLMSNRTVEHQFWLDVGSTGWWERLYQPLTHPYVLSRAWTFGVEDGAPARAWTDVEEYAARQDALACLVLGLVRRCRQQVHLGLSELGEAGNEARGPLLQAIQQVLRRTGEHGG